MLETTWNGTIRLDRVSRLRLGATSSGTSRSSNDAPAGDYPIAVASG